MAETGSPVVHMRAWWQQQLRTLLGVGQKHPLLRKIISTRFLGQRREVE